MPPIVAGVPNPGFFQLDDSAGVLQNLSAKVVSVDGLPGQVDQQDATPFNATGRSTAPGLKSGTFTVTFHYDKALVDQLEALLQLAATSTYEYGPEGNVAGRLRITGECRAVRVGLPISAGQLITVTAEYETQAGWTRNTF